MVKISTSILGIRSNLEQDILKVYNSDTDYIHLDIMDGKFVPNTSFNYEEINNIYNYKKPLDIHLMVEDPIKYINQYIKLNPSYITIHYENQYLYDSIKLLKDNNIKVGVSIKPNTNIELIYKLLPDIDLILIMGVEPGFGGQEFIPNTINKIKKLKQYILNNNYNTLISVDGGVNDTNSCDLINAGCDILVSGSFITNSNDYNKQINKLKYM